MSEYYTIGNQLLVGIDEFPDNFTGFIKYIHGTKFWYQNGRMHRIDGPAIEDSDGTKNWVIFGIECTESQHKFLVDLMKLKNLL